MCSRVARARARKTSGVRPVSASNNDSIALSSPDASNPISFKIRSRISCAALLVNVSAQIDRKKLGCSCDKQHDKYICTSRNVLPDPADARITQNVPRISLSTFCDPRPVSLCNIFRNFVSIL